MADNRRMRWATVTKILFNLGRKEYHWKGKSLAERSEIYRNNERRWFPRVWPRPKIHGYEYAAIATCDGELNTFFDWDEFEEILAYGVYSPVKSKTTKKKAA